jgi:hypothetical protein
MTGRNIGRQDSKRQDIVCRRDFNRKMVAEDRLKIARQTNRRTHRMTGRNIGRQDSKRQETVWRRDFNRKIGADDRLAERQTEQSTDSQDDRQKYW